MRRRRDLAELCIGYGLILLVLWTALPWQRPLYWVATAFLVGASVRSGETWRSLGLSVHRLLRSSGILLFAALAAALAIALAAHHGTLHARGAPGAFIRRYWLYVLWSFMQQFLLQSFFLLRLRRLLPGRTSLAAVLAAVIFALAHLPSPILTIFTLIWGLVACGWFVRYRNLYPLWLAHALLGVTVAICVPAQRTHNMRVGLGYLRYRPPAPPHGRTTPSIMQR